VEHLAEIVGLLVVVGTVGVVTWAVVAVRRRYRALRRRVEALRDGGAVAEIVRQLDAAWRRYPVTDASWRRSRRAQRSMWMAVEGSEKAVRHAEAAGAPVGDLPSLARRLHQSAGDVDRLLSLQAHGAPGTGTDEAYAQAASVTSAAQEIHRAATVSLHRFTSPDVAAVAAATSAEVQALHEGLRASVGPA